jgi:hypothetical protein
MFRALLLRALLLRAQLAVVLRSGAPPLPARHSGPVPPEVWLASMPTPRAPLLPGWCRVTLRDGTRMATALLLKVMPFETRPTRAHPVSTRPLRVPLQGTTTPSVLFPEASKPDRSAATSRTLESAPFRLRRLPAPRIAPGRRLYGPVRLRRACRPSRVTR